MRGIRPGVPGPADYTCTDAQEPFEDYPEAPIYGAHDFWLDFGTARFLTPNSPGLYDSDPTGETLSGLSTVHDNFGFNKTRTYSWFFQKSGTFAGEPEE